jgi:glucose-6-phosphate isomerase
MLEAARAEVLADLALVRQGVPIPPEKVPLDAAFIDLPERLLAEYEANKAQSELGRILKAGRCLAGEVDRIVVLGIGGSYMGARALFEACCHPYHNELSRGERGSHPRLYFEGNNLDNDAVQGLLELLSTPEARRDGWGLVVISKSGGTLETAVAFRLFLRALVEATGSAEGAAARILPVTGRSGKLFDLVQALGCREVFAVPEGVGGRYSVFSAVGLLPAAILGLDVLALLGGAAAMTERFRRAPPGDNPVLDYAGVCSLWEQCGATIRVLSLWAKGLEAVGLWYDQLLSESLGKQERGATPLTVVNTRDLHSRAQQHQEGRRDKLITNVVLQAWRRDPLRVGHSEWEQDGLNALAEKTLPQLMQAAAAGTNAAYREAGRPTATITLPRADEGAIGQLLQMLMLATVVEGRLIGVNPYGQPGVEAYKKHMKAILQG